MARVFISFVNEDKSIADAVKGLIEKELGLTGEVFLSADQAQMLAGEDWLGRIRKDLKSCDVQLLMLSARSLRRPWIDFEGSSAWILDSRRIPRTDME